MQQRILAALTLSGFFFLLRVISPPSTSLSMSAWAAEESASTAPPSSTERAIEDECFRLQNVFRAKNQRCDLAFDEGLQLMARKHAEDMLRRNYFSHRSPEGDGPEERKAKFHPRLFGGTGENLSTVSGSYLSKPAAELAAIIVDGWEHSPGHRRNMLDPEFTHAAIGVAISGNRLRATCNFATEVALLDKPLPTTAPVGARFTITGEARGKVTLSVMDAYLTVPDAKAKFDVPDQPDAYSTGGCFLKVLSLNRNRFQISFHLDNGAGTYELLLGRNKEGRHTFYPGWNLQVR